MEPELFTPTKPPIWPPISMEVLPTVTAPVAEDPVILLVLSFLPDRPPPAVTAPVADTAPLAVEEEIVDVLVLAPTRPPILVTVPLADTAPLAVEEEIVALVWFMPTRPPICKDPLPTLSATLAVDPVTTALAPTLSPTSPPTLLAVAPSEMVPLTETLEIVPVLAGDRADIAVARSCPGNARIGERHIANNTPGTNLGEQAKIEDFVAPGER